jgi:hypothetical protein
MTREVEHQLFQFNKLAADAIARVPRATLHRTTSHAPQAPRVIGRAHDD